MKRLVFGLVALWLLGGCGKGDDKPSVTLSPTPSPSGDPSPKPEIKEPGDERPRAISRPDVPIYPGSKVVHYSEPGVDFSATLSTADELEPVITYYVAHLPANGWTAPGKVIKKGDDEAKLEVHKSGQTLELALAHGGDQTDIRIKIGKTKSKEEDALPLLRGHLLPADFPRDVPLHPDSEVKVRPETSSKLTLAVARKLDQVRDYYLFHLHKKGWKEAAKKEEEFAFHLEAVKGDRLLKLSIEGSEGDLVVVIELKKVEEKK